MNHHLIHLCGTRERTKTCPWWETLDTTDVGYKINTPKHYVSCLAIQKGTDGSRLIFTFTGEGLTSHNLTVSVWFMTVADYMELMNYLNISKQATNVYKIMKVSVVCNLSNHKVALCPQGSGGGLVGRHLEHC